MRGSGRGRHFRGRGQGRPEPTRKALQLNASELSNQLKRIDGKSYGAYHDLRNQYSFDPQRDYGSFVLSIDHVQADPFAAPSRVHVDIAAAVAQFPSALYQSRLRKIALSDYLTRRFCELARRYAVDQKSGGQGWHGAKGGDIKMELPGQHVLERTSVQINDQGCIEARFCVGLPARGRSICGEWAYSILTESIPRLVNESFRFKSLDGKDVWNHIQSVEDQQALRDQLDAAGLAAFIGNGAILPRKSGETDLPMSSRNAIAFKSPASMEMSFTLPNRGLVQGMGIRKGVTLFVGGGFHGKSTVLKALEVGVYNHIPGDGREFVVADAATVKIRAEDSRSIANCDISPFIKNLPFGKDTVSFSTSDASGSTSQAANIIEALEVGAKTLLIDEDTCATNFMIRDRQMQMLVAAEKEPITPYISKVRSLFTKHGVSSILVIGGAGDYFAVADAIIMMNEYLPEDVSEQAKQIAEKAKASGFGSSADSSEFGNVTNRIPQKQSFDTNGKVVTRGIQKIQFGDMDLDLSAVEQLSEEGQTRAITECIHYASSKYMDGCRNMFDIMTRLESDLNEHSLDILGSKRGNFARPRHFEISAAMNRMRSSKYKQ